MIKLIDILNEGIDMSIIPKSIATVNKMLKAKGVKERLVKGKGYYYFDLGNSYSWYTSSVSVYRINELTLQRWWEEYNDLKNDAGIIDRI